MEYIEIKERIKQKPVARDLGIPENSSWSFGFHP